MPSLEAMAKQSSAAAAPTAPASHDLPTDDDFEQAEGRFQSKYDLSEKLGEGTYGTVWKAKAKSPHTAETFAIKVILKLLGALVGIQMIKQ